MVWKDVSVSMECKKMLLSRFSAPPSFRRRAVAQMLTIGNISRPLVFPFHQNTRLRTALTFATKAQTSAFTPPSCAGDSDLNAKLRNAQVEIANQEIFSLLVAEAGNLPTASVQVAERLIIINAAQGVDLTLELVSIITMSLNGRLTVIRLTISIHQVQ